MGKCQYILAKDCVDNSFTVVVDNVECGSDGTVSCTKNVYVHLNGTIITLRGGGTVLIDGVRVANFPSVAESKYMVAWVRIRLIFTARNDEKEKT